MFSKTIFKQTLKANYKLWIIFTIIMCVLSSVIIAVFDPKMISSMMDMLSDTPMADMMDGMMGGMTSLLGMLGQSFYTMQGIILPLIYVIMTANSLIASQVDRGSMAYILSTPIKRITVVRTQALYLVSSILVMFLIVTGLGLCTVQIFQGGVIGEAYTKDVEAISELLNQDEKEVEGSLSAILNNTEAMTKGAEIRGVDLEVYYAYLNLKIMNQAYQEAADVMGINVDEVTKDPGIIKTNKEALAAAAKSMGKEEAIFSAYLDEIAAQNSATLSNAAEMQSKMMSGISAAAKILKMEAADLANDMGKIKSDLEALSAASVSSGIPENVFSSIINQQLAASELALDEGIDFSVKDYLMINLGAFLLMFAISSISFLFSCIFNLSKNSLALGAGIPIAFFIFQIMAQVGDSLKGFKYLSINTLFDTNAIISGGSYFVQFLVLAVAGTVLYIIGMRIFNEKDLPL